MRMTVYSGWLMVVLGVVIGGAIFASRGRHATDPGLPPPKDDVTANPPPLSKIY